MPDDNQKAIESSWLNPRIHVRAGCIAGRGLVARSPIAAGEALVVWGGLYTHGDGAQRARREGLGVMQWDDDLYSVEGPEEDPATLVNHSCDPNAWMSGARSLAARRDIAEDEEITVDYALWACDEEYVSSWECRCGAPGCRRRVTGRDWQRADLQRRYRGHFSPLLNKRIARRCL